MLTGIPSWERCRASGRPTVIHARLRVHWRPQKADVDHVRAPPAPLRAKNSQVGWSGPSRRIAVPIAVVDDKPIRFAGRPSGSVAIPRQTSESPGQGSGRFTPTVDRRNPRPRRLLLLGPKESSSSAGSAGPPKYHWQGVAENIGMPASLGSAVLLTSEQCTDQWRGGNPPFTKCGKNCGQISARV